MKLKQVMFLVLGLGIISSIAIIYFYIIQKDFTKQHREFLLSVSVLENAHIDLEHQILQNSIYAYHNQDEMAATIARVEQGYEKLQESDILKDATYIQTKKSILSLHKDISLNIQNIEEYIMLNAGIKNSLVFLSRRIDEAKFLENKDRNLFIQAIRILKQFNDAKRMQDVDYINKNNFLLNSKSSDAKTQSFIDNFNLHSRYLINRYPWYLQITKTILNNDIHLYIEKLKEEFSAKAISDFKALDKFAFILFSLFIFSLVLIITLFIKYMRENKKLLATKSSLEHSLIYDQLTDLNNRRAFEIHLKTIREPHLLIINIDDFTYINDIYGNDVGNIILQEMAQILKDEFSNRSKTYIYRIGGDEFGILFDEIPSNSAYEIAKTLEKRISNYNFIVYDLTLHLQVSIASNSIVPVLENADLALKRLKKDPTKRVLEYNEVLNLKTNVKKNMNTIELIKSAVKDDRIVPFFQPIINLHTSKIEKYEALVRLKLEDGTFLPPYKFLDIAKKSSYYHFITKTMIEKTLKMAQEFPQYRFSINISMTDIMDDKLTSILFDILKANPNATNRLDIELLESENLQNIEAVQEFITKLHTFGSKILIDDFGSGYSNFSYFSHLDIDLVKIDGSIVSEIETDNRKLHMLTSIHKFSNGMNMKNIAEYVETKEVAQLLKKVGVEYAQGYYFSQPIERPLEDDRVTI